MIQFRVYYSREGATGTWAIDITMENDSSHQDARLAVQATDRTTLFPLDAPADAEAHEVIFSAAIQFENETFKGEAYSEDPRLITELTTPESADFPQTVVVEEEICGVKIRRTEVGHSKDYGKRPNSAERVKAGLSVGPGYGNTLRSNVEPKHIAKLFARKRRNIAIEGDK